jgi:Tol biopolymer transport system component
MNVILFSPNGGAIYRINADGAALAQQTALKGGDVSHRWPQFLPDGRHFIFFARNTQKDSDSLYLASLDGPDITELVESSFGGIYAPPGYLLYVADGALMARTLDLAHARLTGEPMPIVTDVAGSSNFYGAFSASVNGVLAYARNASAAELDWVDRQGRTVSIAAERAGYVDFQLSADGRYLAMGRVEPHSGHPDIHVLDLERGNTRRVTSARQTDASPVWSPDETRLVFRSNRVRVHDLYLVSPTSSRSEELLLTSSGAKYPTDWTADGRRVIYHSDSPETGWDIWAAPVDTHNEPHPLVQTPDDEVQGHISRDGRWLAYTWFAAADTPEVYVKALDGDGTRIQISVHGGSDPHWSADGRELFYIADGMLMSVAVHPHGALTPAKPQPLFRITGARVAAPFSSQYDVDPSGQRFLVMRPLEDPQTLPLNVLVNWTPQSTPR